MTHGQDFHKSPEARRPSAGEYPRLSLCCRLWTASEIAGRGGLVERLHREPTLFHVSARNEGQAEHAGPFSLKTVLSGKSTYMFGRREISVVPGRVLLVPSGARYATRVGGTGAEILTLYFPGKLVSEALSAIFLPAEALIEGAAARGALQSAFPAHLRFVDDGLATMLRKLAQSAAAHSHLTLDILAITAAMIADAAGGVLRVPASRSSVRQELFRRANLARQQIEGELSRDVPLAELAQTACLSPFHLHRIFRLVFGEPPAALRRRLRIERSKELLAGSKMPVRDIAKIVGFANNAAFSRAFRNANSLTPTAFRQSARG